MAPLNTEQDYVTSLIDRAWKVRRRAHDVPERDSVWLVSRDARDAMLRHPVSVGGTRVVTETDGEVFLFGIRVVAAPMVGPHVLQLAIEA